jgi:ubiquinone/menaquinone biosynthesis C-methylase UbiE
MDTAYRVMLLEYRVRDALGLGDPRKQLQRACLQAGETVVDWGCGPGRVSIPAARVIGGGRLVAVDVEPTALQMVREKAAEAGLGNIHTVLLKSHPVAISTASADAVLLIDTFHAAKDKPGLLADIGRILKPGGRLFMDPGHMELEKARSWIDASGLFRLEGFWGRDMLFGKVR